MFEKLLNKQTFREKDIAFVVRNKRLAPKELLVRLGLEAADETVTPEVVAEAPKRARRSK